MIVQEQIRRDQVLVGNPLLNLTTAETEGTFKVKRRWDDDVVFKNCAKGTYLNYYFELIINDPHFRSRREEGSEFHKRCDSIRIPSQVHGQIHQVII